MAEGNMKPVLDYFRAAAKEFRGPSVDLAEFKEFWQSLNEAEKKSYAEMARTCLWKRASARELTG